MPDTFTALVIEELGGQAHSSFKQLTLADLPDDDVLVEVQYSALNYKDGLAVAGNRNKVARSLPMVGGIDLAGTVVESRSPRRPCSATTRRWGTCRAPAPSLRSAPGSTGRRRPSTRSRSRTRTWRGASSASRSRATATPWRYRAPDGWKL